MRLIGHLERSARAYAIAISEMRDLVGDDLTAQQILIAQIRSACDRMQLALAEHEQAHHCLCVETVENLVHAEPSAC
jgi:hypothetical protein